MNTNTENTDQQSVNNTDEPVQHEKRKYPVFVTMGYERDMMEPRRDETW